MNIYKDLEDSLYAYVSSLFPAWRIIFPFQNGPEPQTPYMVIDVKRLDAVGREQSSGGVTIDEFGTGSTTTIQHYAAQIRFEFVGKNDTNTEVAEMAHQLELNLRTPEGYELQHLQNIALYSYAPIERLALKRETDMYMFYQLDTQFGYAVQIITESNWIASVDNITGTYHNAGREPDYTIVSTIEI